ncbi:MAG: DUF6011 domain-containing protein [Cyclobacteriaceae bacterium]
MAQNIKATIYQRNKDGSKRMELLEEWNKPISPKVLANGLYKSFELLNSQMRQGQPFLKKGLKAIKSQRIHIVVSVYGKVVIHSESDDLMKPKFIVDDFSRQKLLEYFESRSGKSLSIDIESWYGVSEPSGFTKENPYSEVIYQMVFNESKFDLRLEKTFTLKTGESFSTILNITEAAILCGGMEDYRARKFHELYFSYRISREDEIEMLFIANMALKKYGPDIVKWCLSLPKLPFRAVNATKLFHEFDHPRLRDETPIFHTLYVDSDGNKKRIVLSFYKEKFRDVIEVKEASSNKRVMLVSRSGQVLVEPNIRDINPILMLFKRFDSDMKEMMIHFGLETGQCGRCLRPLTDPESIRKGIGPVCGGWR